MNLLKIIFLLLCAMTLDTFSQTLPPVEPGVSRELARWRAANYSDVRYKLNLTLEKGAPLMKGEVEIRVILTDEGAKNDLILDWRASLKDEKNKPHANVVGVNDAPDIITQTANEHIRIPHPLLKRGENVIKIQFASPISTSGSAITRYVDKEDGAEYVYSLFVPSDASTAFPCFDQPDLKARFGLEIITPKDWQAVSNTSGDGWIKDSNSNFATYSFPETKPISTYVFAFAAGNFQVFQDYSAQIVSEINGIRKVNKGIVTPKIYLRKSQAEKFKQHAKEVFRLNREAVKYLESYFDYKFPFPKYDLVLIPEFPFGGMEHAGATFLREDRIIFPSEPTANDFITRGNLIFHEAAHQWFGDTVTMRWFDDLWLKEGFAEFMAYKTMEKVLPQYNAWKAFYERNKPLAYLTDSTRGTTPIYQEIPNLSAAKSAYGNIVYRKAPSFLRQAEFYLGADKFQTAVRAFLKNHEFANAEWTDLVEEFETATKQDLKNWAQNWVKQRGLPVIRIKQEDLRLYRKIPEKNNALMHDTAETYRFEQSDALGENKIWRMRLKTLLRHEDGKDEIKSVEIVSEKDRPFATYWIMIVTNPDNRVAIPRLVFPNYQDYGYGIFLLDKKSRNYILANIQNEKDDFLRAMMWGALWDAVREAELNPKDYVELAIKNIGAEKDELTIQTILGRVGTALNYYLPESQTKLLAPRLEKVLFERLKTAKSFGQRIVFNRAFVSLASTESGKQTLKSFLNNRIQNVDLKLRAKDRFDIVTRLLILGDRDAPRLLENLVKSEISDEAKRYAYAARAGVAVASNKAAFYNDFVNNKDISESWIEAAFVPFNAARHADLTLPYLEKALRELPNLKRSRKIFFVNGWLAAFVGGQRDEKALAIVNKFLADNPNLDKDLRLKILEVADGLERAVKIRRKYGR